MKKYRLIIIIAALGIGIALFVALFYAWTDWSGARQLQSALTMLEARKESVRLEDFLPKPIPDERNVAAAPIFKEIFTAHAAWEKIKDRTDLPNKPPRARLSKLEMPWKTTLHPEIPGNLHLVAQQIDPSFHGDDLAAWNLILKALAPSEPILAELHEALARPEIVWPLDYSVAPYEIPLPYITATARAAKILQARALAELAIGEPEKAFGDTETIFSLANIIKEPHFLVVS
jgi:hypothetical protein